MSRNRVIYQSESLYVSENSSSRSSDEHYQIQRIQSANYGFNIPLQDVNQIGIQYKIDSIVVESPTVQLDFSYYPTDGIAESNLGLYVQKNVAIYTGSQGQELNSGQGWFSGYRVNDEKNLVSCLSNASANKNYFIITSNEGSDLNCSLSLNGKSVIGIGNTVLTNFSFEAAIGALPIVNVSAEGLNINSSVYKSYQICPSCSQVGSLTPEIDTFLGVSLARTESGYNNIVRFPNPIPDTGVDIINALRPNDIVLDFLDYGSNSSGLKPISDVSRNNSDFSENAFYVQSVSLDIPLNRASLTKFGSKYAYARVLDYPITATLTVNAILNETQARNIASVFDDSQERDISLTINSPKLISEPALRFKFKGSRLNSESFSSNTTSSKTVALIFETQVGSSSDPYHGVFLSGNARVTNEVPSLPAIHWSGEYGSPTASEWYNVSNWYTSSSFSINATGLPVNTADVFLYGSTAPYVDIDDVNWVPPKSIDSTNVSDPDGIIFYSSEANQNSFTGTVIGNSTFTGWASFT